MKRIEECHKSRLEWINFAKFAAIMAVLTNHSSIYLTEKHSVLYCTYYSVPLFILLMGYTTYISFERSKAPLWKKVLLKCTNIWISYMVAIFIYQIFETHYFDMERYCKDLIAFDGVFYYVFLYIQLALISPLVFGFVSKTKQNVLGIVHLVIGLFLVCAIGIFTTHFSNVFSVYGGGGKLFGGTYLILLYLGCCLAFVEKCICRIKFIGIWTILFIIATVLCGVFLNTKGFVLDSYFMFGDGLNPPGVSLMIYSVLFAVSSYLLEKYIAERHRKVCGKGYHFFAHIGEHTLYIFLYHMLFLEKLLPSLSRHTGIVISIVWIKIVVYIGCMIVGPIVLDFLLHKVKVTLGNTYEYRARKD